MIYWKNDNNHTDKKNNTGHEALVSSCNIQRAAFDLGKSARNVEKTKTGANPRIEKNQKKLGKKIAAFALKSAHVHTGYQRHYLLPERG